jgi:hypothetical protein
MIGIAAFLRTPGCRCAECIAKREKLAKVKAIRKTRSSCATPDSSRTAASAS